MDEVPYRESQVPGASLGVRLAVLGVAVGPMVLVAFSLALVWWQAPIPAVASRPLDLSGLDRALGMADTGMGAASGPPVRREVALPPGPGSPASGGGRVTLSLRPQDHPLYLAHRSEVREAWELGPGIRAYGRWRNALKAAAAVEASWVNLTDGREGLALEVVDSPTLAGDVLHLREGDVLLSLNGRPLPRDLGEARAMLEELSGGTEFLLELVRDGDRYDIYYRVAP